MRSFTIVYSLLFATSVAAQAPARAVRGIVFDSVAGAPLAGAIIQVALTDTVRGPSERRLFSGISDSAGHYMVSGLVPGHYVIGFQHDALLALGIESPLRAFEVSADGISSMDLATPSVAVLRAARCGKGDPSRPGMLYGSVSDARNGARPDGGVVTVNWTEVGIKDNKLRSMPFSIRAPVADDGSFLACGLTTDATLSLRVTATSHRTLDGDIVVPSSGVL
ncbi:MAG: carboxypeptidase-like regulatory domain-containing protein, partial [Gemmatimonadaceae bacterium]